MFTHVEILALAQQSDIDKTVKVLKALAHKIDAVADLEVGQHDMPTPRCGHVVWIARFADRDGYDSFQQDPEYAKTRQFLERVDAKTVHVAFTDFGDR